MSLLTLRGNSATGTAAATAAAAAVKPKSVLRPNPDFAEADADDLADILQKFIRVAGQVGWPTLFPKFRFANLHRISCEYFCETYANLSETMQT